MPPTSTAQTGHQVRLQARNAQLQGPTAGLAPGYLQANVVILPQRYAADFLLYCHNNPKPCPLLAVSTPGNTSLPTLGQDIDLRDDIPRYRRFEHGQYVGSSTSLQADWQEDLVSFALGCSFSFEEALIQRGLGVKHIEQQQNVPMFKTSIPTLPAGMFSGPLVVTMRPYKAAQLGEVFDLCAHYPHAHGAPIYWGDPHGIGIDDLSQPDYGQALTLEADEVPVFWACGVTTQAAIDVAKPALCLTHEPGHMLLTDLASELPPARGESSMHLLL